MNKKNLLSLISIATAAVLLTTTGCSDIPQNRQDVSRTNNAVNSIVTNQPTPTDLSYSLERYNLIRRAYWVNGQKEKARTVTRPTEVPLGYCVLFSAVGGVVAHFSVDGKVTSLNSYLTASEAYVEYSKGGAGSAFPTELPDVDGSYGENDGGIFFFTPNWQYIEWSGDYIYSDTPFKVETTILGEY